MWLSFDTPPPTEVRGMLGSEPVEPELDCMREHSGAA